MKNEGSLLVVCFIREIGKFSREFMDEIKVYEMKYENEWIIVVL